MEQYADEILIGFMLEKYKYPECWSLVNTSSRTFYKLP